MKTIILTIIITLLSCTSLVYAQQNTPSDFPKYQDTGNQKADNAAYDKAKKAWVEANPDAYKKMNDQLKANATVNKIKPQNTQKKEGIATMIPDDVDYDEGKKAWIKANPEAYQKMGGQPQIEPEVNENPVVIESENCEPAKESTIIIPDDCTIWAITDAVLIDENNQLKTSKLDKEQASFKKEMLTPKVLWKISSDDILYILNNEKYTSHFKFEKADKQLKLFPPDDTSCNNQIKIYHIKKWTDSQIIINMPDEDEGSTLVYQLTLTPAF